MRNLLVVLFVSLAGCSSIDKQGPDDELVDEASEDEETESTPELLACDGFAVCWDDDANFDKQYVYASDSAQELVVVLESLDRTEGISRLELRIPDDVSAGQELAASGSLRHSAPPQTDRMLDGQLVVLDRTDTTVGVTLTNLTVSNDEGDFFLMKEATLEFDCIGEPQGTQCGGDVRLDACGIEREFYQEQCDG